MTKPFVAIFVEGDTEKEFYELLLQYYRNVLSTSLPAYKVFNLKSIGRFENKMSLKLKNEILNVHEATSVKVICCYDSDVFDLGKKPPINWNVVKNKIEALGISNFHQVKAKQMIEDWFLADLSGICNYLKIKGVKRIEGRNGYDKLKKLFKKAGKIYIKGSNTQKIIPNLNMALIREHAKEELRSLEKALGVNILKKVSGKTK